MTIHFSPVKVIRTGPGGKCTFDRVGKLDADRVGPETTSCTNGFTPASSRPGPPWQSRSNRRCRGSCRCSRSRALCHKVRNDRRQHRRLRHRRHRCHCRRDWPKAWQSSWNVLQTMRLSSRCWKLRGTKPPGQSFAIGNTLCLSRHRHFFQCSACFPGIELVVSTGGPVAGLKNPPYKLLHPLLNVEAIVRPI